MGLLGAVGTGIGAYFGGTAGASVGGAIGGGLDASMGGSRVAGSAGNLSADQWKLIRQQMAENDAVNKRNRELYYPMEDQIASDNLALLQGQDPARLTGAMANQISGTNTTYDSAINRLQQRYASMGRAGGNMTMQGVQNLELGRAGQIAGIKTSQRQNAYNRAMNLMGRGKQISNAGMFGAGQNANNMALQGTAFGVNADLAGSALMQQGISKAVDWWGNKGKTTPTGGSSGAINNYNLGGNLDTQINDMFGTN